MEGSCAQNMYNAAARLVRKVPERGNAPLVNLTPLSTPRQIQPAINDHIHISRDPPPFD